MKTALIFGVLVDEMAKKDLEMLASNDKQKS